jgi:outer membrane receptor protein involved in Fe transport
MAIRQISGGLKSPLLAWGLLALFSVIVPASGEEKPDAADESPLGLSLNSLLSLHLTTGSFLDLDLANSPFSMTLIERQQIENSGARHLSELLEIYVPGFQYMYNKWNGIIWGMRGIANDRNAKFIYLVNGHKLNSQSRDGAVTDLSLGMLGEVERVEVLRGPAGLVYGSGAIAGIVNVVTRASEGNRTILKGATGSWNSHEGEAQVHAEPAADQDLVFSMGARKSDGLGLRESRLYARSMWPFPSWLELGNPNGVPGDGSAWATPGNYRMSADWNWRRLRWYTRFTHQVTDAGAFFIQDPWPDIIGAPDSTAPDRLVDGKYVKYNDPFWSQTESWGTNRREFLHEALTSEVSYKHPIAEDELEFRLGVDGFTQRGLTMPRTGYENDLPANPVPFVYETFGERRYTLSSMYLLGRVPKLQAALGAEARLDDLGDDMQGDNAWGGNPKHPVITPIQYWNGAVYAEGFYRYSGRLGFHFGSRYDIHTRTARFGGMLSPKAALLFTPVPGHTVKAVVQSSTNNGTVDNYEYNLGQYNDSGKVEAGDHLSRTDIAPDHIDDVVRGAPSLETLHSLRPERIYSFELLSLHTFGDMLTLQPSASYNYVKDLFAWSQALYRVVNAGVYRFVNVDLETSLRLPKLTLGFNHTWQVPVGTDPGASVVRFTRAHYDTSGVWYDSALVNGSWRYRPVPSPSRMDTVEVNPVADQITRDGDNFLSLATHVSKFQADYSPWPWLNLHTDARVFWGLQGRDSIYSEDEGRGFNSLGIQSDAMTKWNASMHFRLDGGLRISLHVYDLLGVDKWTDDENELAIHTLRWHQMGTADQKDLYSVDQRSYALRIEKAF